MKRFFCMILTLVLCVLYAPPPSRAVDTDTVLRVGLYYGSTAVSSVTLSSAGGFSFGTVSGTTFSSSQTSSAASVTITASGASSFTVKDSSGAAVYTASGDHIAIRGQSGLTTLGDYTYYGDFVLRASSSGALTVINYVALDDYVKGVLPYEMSASWPIEALKAQALCARSYALGNLNKHKSYGFDLCNTTNCQVYRGTDRATSNSDAAVDQTTGQLLMANGKLAVGYFFASDGGATEDNENVWGGDPVSYLRGVKDPYEDTASASNGVWSVTLTAAEVASKLKSAGYSIGTVSTVQVTKRTAMDNVNQVVVTDTSGTSVTLKNSAVRTAFGLNSIRYTINGQGSSSSSGGGLYVNGAQVTDGSLYAVGGSGQSSAIGSASGKTALIGSGKQTISVSSGTTTPSAATPAGSFTFDGTGWGHSVGMSQYGALAMAKQGFTYDQIVKFYFTGVTIATN